MRSMQRSPILESSTGRNTGGRSRTIRGRMHIRNDQGALRACGVAPHQLFPIAVRSSWSRLDARRRQIHMKREILINANPRETRVAIIEDDQLVELLVDRPEARRMVGDIYLGKVEAVLPGIQAAFVDIGTEKSAFLHASDLVFDEDSEDDDAEEEENGDADD